MTTQLPKERLEEIAELARKANYKPCAMHMSNLIASCDSETIEAMGRALLAAYEQEPVARVVSKFGDPEAFGERELEVLVDIQKLPYNTPFYTHPAPSIPAAVPEVDADDNFYSWFGREWYENYQQNQYTAAAKQMLGVMAESAWKASRRAAMLQSAPKAGE